jgi:hypothetical protein
MRLANGSAAANLAMVKTFEEAFCEEHRCDRARFLRKVFWQTLPWRAVLFAPFLGGFNSRYFAADRELVYGVSRAVYMGQVREEIRDYFSNSQNRGWLRTVANVRISSQRLKRLAKQHLPERESNPSRVVQ